MCCLELYKKGGFKSPFTKIIIFGYYDGPTAGIAYCNNCAIFYRFEMIGWDDYQAVRIYMLLPLESNDYIYIEQLLSSLELPKWPVWFPNLNLPTKEKLERVFLKIDQLLEKVKSPFYVIASPDLSNIIFSISTANGREKILQEWQKSLSLQDFNKCLQCFGLKL